MSIEYIGYAFQWGAIREMVRDEHTPVERTVADRPTLKEPSPPIETISVVCTKCTNSADSIPVAWPCEVFSQMIEWEKKHGIVHVDD